MASYFGPKVAVVERFNCVRLDMNTHLNQCYLSKFNFKQNVVIVTRFFSVTIGMQISRPYTVVLPSLQVDPSEREYDGKRFYLMIKLYPEGTLTPTLNPVVAGQSGANLKTFLTVQLLVTQ